MPNGSDSRPCGRPSMSCWLTSTNRATPTATKASSPLPLTRGIGWLEEEFRALGIPWERRAQRTREYVEAMRRLWGDALSSYKGEFVNFENVRSFPKPMRGGDLP